MVALALQSTPNVTPMVDVMLVLLIIFMVVAPALLAGFNAEPPQAQNIKDHPEDDETDQVLGIDKDGNYYLNKKPIEADDVAPALAAASTSRRRAKTKSCISRPTRTSTTARCSTRMDIAMHNGVAWSA